MFMAKVKAISAGLVLLSALGAVAGGLLATRLSANGAPAATAARDGDTPRGEEPRPVVVREEAQIAQAALSPGGDVVAAISRRWEVIELKRPNGPPVKSLAPFDALKLWDARTGELKRLLEPEGKKKGLVAIAFSSDKRYLAIAGTRPEFDKRPAGESFVRILDARTFAVQQEIVEVPNPNALAFSPDGKTLAIGGSYRLAETGTFVKLWDIEGERMRGGTRFRAVGSEGGVPTFGSPPPDMFDGLAFSPDGKLVAAAVYGVASKRAKIRLFNGHTGDFQRELEVSEGDRPPVFFQAAFSPDGKDLIIADGPVRFWGVETGKVRRTLTPPNGSVTHLLAISPDGRQLAAGGVRGEKEKATPVLLLWDLKTGEVRDVLPWKDAAMFVASVAFSGDGTSLAVAGMTGPDQRFKDGEKTRGELCVLRLGR
jgi:WD40 repeat protein